MTGFVSRPELDSQWPLVGRHEVLERVQRALDRPAEFDLIEIHGAAGAGKTRLAAEIADRVAAAGRTVDKLTAREALAGIPGAAIAPLFGGDSPESTVHDAVELFHRARRLTAERTAAAKSTELTLIVDGLTSLDPVSARLIAQLVAAQSVVLIATLRDGEQLPEAMADLANPARSVRIDLAPLTLPESDVLLQTVLRGTVATRTVLLLYRATRGNPFYLRELTVAAVTAGNLQLTAGVWQLVGDIPAAPALRALMLARLRGLDPVARDTVERIALTEPLPVAELRVPGDVLEDLEERGLIVSDDADGRLTVSIAHPLYGNAVRAGISRLRANTLLAEQAGVLRQRPLGKGDQLRLARWLVAAGEPVEADMIRSVVRLALTAGQYSSVIRFTDAVPPADRDVRLLAMRAEALRRLARLDEAVATLETAISLDRSLPDAERMGAELVSLLALTHADGVAGIQRGLGVLDQESTQVSGDLKALMSARWFLLYYAERVHEALAVLAELQPGPRAEAADLARYDMAMAMPLVSVGRTAEGLAAAQRAADFSTSPRADPMIIRPHSAQLMVALARFQSGLTDQAAAPAELALQQATAADDEYVARYASFLLGRIEMEAGRFGAAERWFREVAGVAQVRGPAAFRVPALAGLTLSLAALGRLAEAGEFEAELRSPGGDRDFLVVEALAVLDAAHGHGAEAAARLLARADTAEQGGHLFFAGSLLDCLRRLGFPDPARERLTRIAARTDSVHLHRLAGIGVQVADALTRPIAPIAPIAPVPAVPANPASAAPTRPLSAVDPLTRREREIATLAREGLSSNEIAEKLFLSVRTVNNHLQSVYAKLGVRSRRELPHL